MFRCLLLSSLFFLFLKGFSQSNLHYVDPSIGGVGIILESTRPAVHLPNSMLRVFPQRRDHLDDQIHNFPLTITSHRRHLAFAFLPLSGEKGPEAWNTRLTYFQEKLSPYHYSTSFEESGDMLEFSPQSRSGYFRIHFKNNVNHYLRFGIFNGMPRRIIPINLSSGPNFLGMSCPTRNKVSFNALFRNLNSRSSM